MKLIFEPDRIPRTTTRTEWRRIHRWRRITERRLNEAMEANRNVLARAIEECAFMGTSALKLREDMIYELVNPSVMVYP